jgi:DNA-binding transcriptional regulator YiaG
MTPTDIKEARLRLGLSQAQLAQRLQVPADTFAKWERGDLAIRHAEVLRLALERLEQARQP